MARRVEVTTTTIIPQMLTFRESGSFGSNRRSNHGSRSWKIRKKI